MASTTGVTAASAGFIQEQVTIGKRTWTTLRADPSFADELSRTAQTQTADRAAATDEEKLAAALDKLSASSKDMLDRLKLNISKEEWWDFLVDLKDAGLISGEECFMSHPGLVLIGYTDANGDPVIYPPPGGTASEATTYNTPDGAGWGAIVTYANGRHLIGETSWTGNPFQTMYQWLDEMWKWKTELDDMVRPNGVKYDTSHITQWMDARQRVYGVIAKLIELA